MSVTEREKPQATVDAEASAWLARGRMGLSAADDRAFEVWQAADARHRAAFERMSRTLADIASLKHLAELEPLEAAPRRVRLMRTPGRIRAAVAGLSAVAAVAVAVALAPGVLDRPDLDASTAVGEMRTVRLADSSRVTLGARSRIRVDFEAGARRVKLSDGEAFFEVAHDPSRPFFVETGGAVVRVVGTKFDVRQAAGRVEVSVLEGVVQVRERGLIGREVRTLRAGERVRAQAAPALSLAPAPMGQVQLAAATPGAWREGQLTYDGASLAEIVADLNRYYGPGVRLDSRTLGEARLAASFKVHEIDAFLRELPAVAPVAVTRDAAGAVTISERPAAPPA